MRWKRKTPEERVAAQADKLQRIAAKQSTAAERPEVKTKSFWRTGAL